jgi:phage tail-like protein
MAEGRERPYMQFNFTVNLGLGADANSPQGGFQEMSNVGMEMTVAEYRTGNSIQNSVMKLTALNKSTDVTLKRGMIGALDLYKWLDDIRNGDQRAMRTVTVTLLSEARQPVMTWSLNNARITKSVFGPFNAKGTEVAMEEMTLTYERLTLALGA